MNCPHCASATAKERTRKTTLGYRVFRCSACKHRFNERTGTPFNFLEYPPACRPLEFTLQIELA